MTEITYLHIEMNLFYVHLIMYSDMWELLCVEYSHTEQAKCRSIMPETNGDITVTPCSPNIGAEHRY